MISPAVYPDLIYDLGAHNGDDTFRYLSQGYRVVAVEANPSLAGQLQRRFAAGIGEGRFQVVNAAVTDTEREKVTFYVSAFDWESSLIKYFSTRESAIRDTIEVPGRTLESLFREFGIPHYCKMDLEGYDAPVIGTLTSVPFRPAYLSCEACCHMISDVDSREELLYLTLDGLQTAGYEAFKIVDQEHLVVLAEKAHYSRLHSWSGRIEARLRRLAGIRPPATAPFGEQLPGEWKDYASTKKYLQYHFRDYFRLTQNKKQMFWVDIHAK